MAIFTLLVVVGALYAASRAIPKPQDRKPPGLSEIQAPTAEEGRAIPKLWGTREIKSQNCIWYGDIKTVAIRK